MTAAFRTVLRMAVGLAAALLLVGPAAAQAVNGELADFDRWWRDHQLGKAGLGDSRNAAALRTMASLFRALAEREDRHGVDRLLVAASLPLDVDPGDPGRHLSRRPWVVVDFARRALGRVRSPGAIQQLEERLKAALQREGTRRNPRHTAREEAETAEVLRALGAISSTVHWPVMADMLSSVSPPLRRAAAEGLAGGGMAGAVPALLKALEAEADETARIAQVDALRELLLLDREEARTHRRAAVRAVAGALGKGTWRGDLAKVQFLRLVRSPDAIPPLIDAVERCAAALERPARPRARPGEGEEASGTLLAALHEALGELTGFVAPRHDPGAWRGFWDKVKDTFELPSPPEVRLRAEDEAGEGARTVAGGFFGINVTGSRVVFVLDLSGSMNARMGTAAARGQGALTRLDVAKQELARAVENLSATTTFNVLYFSAAVRSWRRELTQATPANKQAFLTDLERVQAGGSTNLFGGIHEALGMRTADPGDRYGSPLDELVILSDGAASSGTVVRHSEILRLVNETNRYSRVVIHTVFLGAGSRAEESERPEGAGLTAMDLMRELAAANGGRFVAR